MTSSSLATPAREKERSFRFLSAADVSAEAILRLLSESFAREPMAAALGVKPQDLAPLIALFLPQCRSNGLSVVAVPADDLETLAGVFLVRDFRAPLPEGVMDHSWFQPIAEALMAVGTAYEAAHADLGLGEVADLWMVGTDPRFARRGLATRLFRLCVGLAAGHGFTRCVTECTGYYSQSAARRAGFTEVSRLAYRDFRSGGRPVFADIAAPHAHLVFYERAFSSAKPYSSRVMRPRQ
jgi:GNAT superfamily N-acetyltransferase